MRYLAVVAVLLALGCGPRPGYTFEIAVTSTPPGAEVCASPVDQPIIYRKGMTPCRVELGDNGAPFAVLIRKPGCFDVYRYVSEDSPDLSVELASRDESANWARLPALTSLTSLQAPSKSGRWAVLRNGRIAREITGLPRFVGQLGRWAPDGSGALCHGSGWGPVLVEEGLAERDTDGAASDLWWVPVDGSPELIWRWHVEQLREPFTFGMEGDFAPDPRWCVHSATGEGREHLRLRSLATGESRVIATDADAWLYSPRFSPSGRLVACVRDSGFSHERRPAGIEVMHFNGSGRRTVADDADEDLEPIFSPDERHIAYVNLKGNVCVVSVGGGSARVAIDAAEWKAWTEPAWSPDATRVAVTCVPRTAERQLAPGMQGWMRPSGALRIIWAGIDKPQSGFVRGAELLGWHTDDSLLAAISGFVVPAGTGYERLAAVGLDGSIRRVLREPEAVLDGAVESPNGQWVAAVGWHGDDSWDVYLHDTEARETAKVTSASLSGRPEVGWTTEGELWVSAEGDAGVLIRPGDRSVRPVARPAELVPSDESRAQFECEQGDLFKGKAIGRPGPLGMTGLERRTYLNAQVTLAPTTDFGGGS